MIGSHCPYHPLLIPKNVLDVYFHLFFQGHSEGSWESCFLLLTLNNHHLYWLINVFNTEYDDYDDDYGDDDDDDDNDNDEW